MRKENIRKQKIIKKRSIRGKAEHALDFRDDISRPILDAKRIAFGELFPILNVRSKNLLDLPYLSRA